MDTSWHAEEARSLLSAGRQHPDPRDLLAFVRCEASKTARRAIVRHLLRGCPACAAVVRPMFHPGGEHARR